MATVDEIFTTNGWLIGALIISIEITKVTQRLNYSG